MHTTIKTSSAVSVRAEEKASMKMRMTGKMVAVLIALCFCAFTNKTMGQTWNTPNHGVGDGSTGQNLTATLSNGTLTIRGSGNMADYLSSKTGIPWYDYRSSIKTVIIESGVTNIGDGAFLDCNKLTSVTIPNTVTIILR